MRWRRLAKCANDDSITLEFFFPDHGLNTHAAKVWDYCSSCPVRLDCLDEALELPYHQDAGYWGGLSLKDRNQIRRANGTYWRR